MKNNTLMKIIASALAVCVAAGTVPATAWAAEDSLSGGSGYVSTPEPGEKQGSGVTPGSGARLSDGFSDEGYTEDTKDYNGVFYLAEVTVKTKYTVGSGHIYYAPAGTDGDSAFLRLENVHKVFIQVDAGTAPITVEAAGSNSSIRLEIAAYNSSNITLTGSGDFDSLEINTNAGQINKEGFTGRLNAMVFVAHQGLGIYYTTVYGNCVYESAKELPIGLKNGTECKLTISEGSSLTVSDNAELVFYPVDGLDYSSYLNMEGSLINDGKIIFLGAEPEDPLAFVESFGFSGDGNGMVTVTSASDEGSITNDNSKVYDHKGFPDMTDSITGANTLELNGSTPKSSYRTDGGRLYYTPPAGDSPALLKLENVHGVFINVSVETPITVEAAGSNSLEIAAYNSSNITLTGSGDFDSLQIRTNAGEINKESFTGRLNAMVFVNHPGADTYLSDVTVYGNCVYEGAGWLQIGLEDETECKLTISEGSSLTIADSSELVFYPVDGLDYSSYLNMEGSLKNDGKIIFLGAKPEDPLAFVESFGFSEDGNGMVTVTSASDEESITNDNSKVYDHNGFLDMTGSITGENTLNIDGSTPKSFYRIRYGGRLYYTPPAGRSPALLKACDIYDEMFKVSYTLQDSPVTLCLVSDNCFTAQCCSDVTLDGTGFFDGEIDPSGEILKGEGFKGSARIKQKTKEESESSVLSIEDFGVWGDYSQSMMEEVLVSKDIIPDGDIAEHQMKTLTVPEGSSYKIGADHVAYIKNIGNDFENYLKIDGKIINNGIIECTGEVPDDRTAFIRSLNLSGSGFVVIDRENGVYTNDGIKATYHQETDLDFGHNTGNDVWGDHMDEYGYRFEEKDGSYVLTLQDFISPCGVEIPDDKPIIINSSGVCVIGSLHIASSGDAGEAALTFGGDGLLTVNSEITVSQKNSVTTIDENAKITANNGFAAFAEERGRLIVNGTLNAMCCDEMIVVYADALEIGNAGILNVSGNRGGIWINKKLRNAAQTGYSLEIKEGGQLITDCREYGLAICNFAGNPVNNVISVPEGYMPHGYKFIEAPDDRDSRYTTLVLALKDSDIWASAYSGLVFGEGAEGYIAIHSHSADYDKYIPDPDHPGRHIRYCSNGSGHSDSAEACTFGDWVQTVAPTETSTGVKTRTCSVCGGTGEETIPKLISVSLKTGTDVSLKNNALTYGEPLSKLVFNEAEFIDTDGNTVAGALAWKDAAAAPDAGTAGAAWVFTPAEEKYASLEGMAAITVNKAVPTISTAPAVTGRVYDPSITLKDDDLSGGIVTGVDGGSLGGTWSWQDRDIVPAVGNSGYEAVFTPEDAKNYETVTAEIAVDVTKAQNAPNIPDNSINVLNTVKKAGSVRLPEGWEWQEADKEKTLAAGASVEAVAVYTGGDKGNYEKESVTVAITRSACDDASGEILYTGEGEKAPACTEDGLGHKECSLCGDVTESGIVVKATGHDWRLTSEEAATATSEGKRVYTCSGCSRTREETIPKLPPTPTGTPVQTEAPLPTGEPVQTENPLPTGIPGQTENPLPTGTPEQTENPLPTPAGEPVQTENPLPTGIPGQTENPLPTGTPEQPAKQPQDKAAPEKVKEISAELNSGISVKWKGNALALKWKKTAGAEGYDVFAAPGGKKPDKKSPVKTVKNGKTSVSLTKIDGKKISGKKVYSVQIKAWKYVDGKKEYTGESTTYHIAGKDNKKYTNVKKLKPEKKKCILKKGKSARLQVTVVKEAENKKLLPNSYGPALQYRSDHETVATVTRNGRVKAKKKGTCYIYATALNGVSTRIKITVK